MTAECDSREEGEERRRCVAVSLAGRDRRTGRKSEQAETSVGDRHSSLPEVVRLEGLEQQL